MNRLAIIREFLEFLRERKKWWIAPIVIFLLLLGGVLVCQRLGTGAVHLRACSESLFEKSIHRTLGSLVRARDFVPDARHSGFRTAGHRGGADVGVHGDSGALRWPCWCCGWRASGWIAALNSCGRPVCWAVVAFTLYAIARYFTADVEYVARQELVRVLVYAFLFFAILNNLHGQESTRIVVFTLTGLAMLISGYAIYQFVSGSDRVWHFVNPYKHRGSGTYINPNHLAGFLEMIVPVSLAWALTSRAKPVTKILIGYASLVLLAGITVTLSRAAWIATGGGVLVMLVMIALRSVFRWPALVLLVVAIGAGFAFIPRSFFLKKRWELVNRDLAEGKVSDVRPAIWHAATQMWQENPWWGIGPGHFDQRFRAFPSGAGAKPAGPRSQRLSEHARGLGRGGAPLASSPPGCCSMRASFTLGPSVRGSLSDLGGRSSNKFAFVFGASLGLLALLLHSVADFNMHIPANAILAVTWMALLSAHLRFATERYWVSVPASPRRR
ncbi:MAG: O-antigen ligase family protein [Candidatus Moduliflexus flocculans]|nr:O-antigen ligase family protein [Candidatus Moduliflexus flocculans]